MSAEHRPVFQEPVPLQPEQQNPDTINLLPKKEGFQEEKMTSISKQFTILKLFEMHGATAMITKDNFPDIPEERLETFRFFSDTNRIKELQLQASLAMDEEEKESYLQEAEELKQKRSERSKKLRELTRGKPIILKKVHTQTTTPTQIELRGQYL